MPENFSIQHLDHWLQLMNVEIDGVEFHGLISGLTVAGGTSAQDYWFELAEAKPNSDDIQYQDAMDGIQAVLVEVAEQLNDPLLSFNPLGIEDEEAVAEQMTALGRWCQGFILGISHQGLPNNAEQSNEVQEFLADLAEISRLESFELAGDESDAASLYEISEYIKTGVLILQEELRPIRHPDVTSHPLH
jgi:uncharacterized protein